MAVDPTVPDAQGQTPADTQVATDPNQQATVPPGVQARIDELTAKVHATERIAEQKSQEVNQLLEAVAALTAAQAAPRVDQGSQTPPVDVDPEEARRIQAAMAPYLRELSAKVDRLVGMQGQQSFQQAAAVEDPEVVQLAQQLLNTWQKNGYTGWKPEDALVHARGIVAGKQRAEALKANGQRAGMNGAGQQILMQQSGHMQNGPTDGLPANFDALSPQKQLEILERRLDGKTF